MSIALPAIAAPDLRTLAGKNVEGELVAITDKEVILAKDGKRTSVPFAEILQIDFQKAGESATGGTCIDVELTDGTLLHCKKVACKGKDAQLNLLGSDAVQHVPLQSISNILNVPKMLPSGRNGRRKFSTNAAIRIGS